MKRLARLALPLALPVALSGCASGAVTALISCQVGNAVSVSRHDKLTEKTASDIEANNKSRAAAGCDEAGNG